MVNEYQGYQRKYRLGIFSLLFFIESLVGFEYFGTWNKPFLCIYGQLSKKYPLEVFKKVFPNWEQKHLVEINGAGHWVHLERINETLVNIDKFYKEM